MSTHTSIHADELSASVLDCGGVACLQIRTDDGTTLAIFGRRDTDLTFTRMRLIAAAINETEPPRCAYTLAMSGMFTTRPNGEQDGGGL